MGPVPGLSEKVPEGELLPPGPGPSCSAGISVGEAASPAVRQTWWEQGGRLLVTGLGPPRAFLYFLYLWQGKRCGLLLTLGLSGAPRGACSLPPSPRPSPPQRTPETWLSEPWSSLPLAHLGLCSEAAWLPGVVPRGLGRCLSCDSAGQRPSGPPAACPCLRRGRTTRSPRHLPNPFPLKANCLLSTLGWQ